MTTAKHSLQLLPAVSEKSGVEAADEERPLTPSASPDDASLVAGMRSGDAVCALTLYERHVENVRRLLWQLLGPDAALEDVVQQVFLAVADSVHQLRDPEALGSWIVGVTVRTARREIRQRRRWRRHRDLPAEDAQVATAPASAQDCQRVARLFALLSRLEATERIAFVLRYAEGYQLAEVAGACDCSLATVKRRLRRARQQVLSAAAEDFWLAPLLEEDPDE